MKAATEIPMQLWIVNQYALPANSPGGTRHADLAAQLNRSGIECTILASERPYYEQQDVRRARKVSVERRGDANFVWIPTINPAGNGLRRLLGMVQFAVRVLAVAMRSRRYTTEPPEAILGSSPHLFGAYAGYLAARRLRVPFILEIRDVWPDSLVELGGLRRHHPLYLVLRLMERSLYRRSSAIASLLPSLDPHVTEALRGQTRPVVWLPNFQTVPVSPDSEPQWVGGKDLRVVYAGAHGVANNLETLLDVAQILQDENIPTSRGGKFIIDLYGDGVNKESLRRRAAAAGLRNIHFHDPVPKKEMREILHLSDVAVLPGLASDLYRHGVSPNKLMDYAAASLPIIFALDAPNNLVALSGCGIVAKPDDADSFLNALLQIDRLSDAERWKMGHRGRDYVARIHSVESISGQLLACLHELVHLGRPVR